MQCVIQAQPRLCTTSKQAPGGNIPLSGKLPGLPGPHGAHAGTLGAAKAGLLG